MFKGVSLEFWGKLSRTTKELYHPLICHLLDTGFVTARLLQDLLPGSFRKWVAETLGLDEEAVCQWVTFWSALHDIGKATPAFQCKAAKHQPGRIARLQADGYRIGSPGATGHGILTARILSKCFMAPGIPGQLPPALAGNLAIVLGGHHGVFPSPREIQNTKPGDLGDSNWAGQQMAIYQALAGLWQVKGLPLPQPTNAAGQVVYAVIAGLVSVADWIASFEGCFPYAGQDCNLENYLAQLPDRAASALGKLGWTQWKPRPEATFAGLFGFEPNRMQTTVAGLSSEVRQPGLFIIEAPMGLGKTEAAFDLVRDLLLRLGHRGVYIALPTQATSNQMFHRFADFASKLVAKGTAGIQLLHGQAMLCGEFQDLRPTSIEDITSNAPSLAAMEWFSAPKRGLLAPFGVGTIDQSLLSVLQTRHFFVRLFGLAGKVVVLDEVHAYDTYTSNLMLHLVRWVGRMGCSVVLLSATLPAAKRRELLAAFDSRTAVTDAPYPRVTQVSEGLTRSESIAVETTARVHVEAVEPDPHSLGLRLKSALSGGGCAAWICNTVGRSQEVFKVLRQLFAGEQWHIDLLHARFPAGQRRQKEDQVIQHFGKEGWRQGQRPKAAVLVATQIIEQSLDLDFDIMVTDLAPVDIVLQRTGRLHRHRVLDGQPTRRPARLAQPSLWLAAPAPLDGLPPSFGSDEWVYERYLLLRSYLCLVRPGLTSIEIPPDLERLIELVYGDLTSWPLNPAWQEALKVARRELEHNAKVDDWEAQCRLIPQPDAPDGFLSVFNRQLEEADDLAAKTGVGAVTRKAAPSIRIICLHEAGGNVYLDAECLRRVDLARAPDRPALLALLDQSVPVMKRGLVEHFAAEPVPQAWRQAPILRNCRPLFLRGGLANVAGFAVQLDPDLGLVVAKGGNIEKEG
jgi:CRISPR-associated endonuclease/helicase Cas3